MLPPGGNAAAIADGPGESDAEGLPRRPRPGTLTAVETAPGTREARPGGAALPAPSAGRSLLRRAYAMSFACPDTLPHASPPFPSQPQGVRFRGHPGPYRACLIWIRCSGGAGLLM